MIKIINEATISIKSHETPSDIIIDKAKSVESVLSSEGFTDITSTPGSCGVTVKGSKITTHDDLVHLIVSKLSFLGMSIKTNNKNRLISKGSVQEKYGKFKKVNREIKSEVEVTKDISSDKWSLIAIIT